jgi:hypothetical protein
MSFDLTQGSNRSNRDPAQLSPSVDNYQASTITMIASWQKYASRKYKLLSSLLVSELLLCELTCIKQIAQNRDNDPSRGEQGFPDRRQPAS